MKGLFQNKKIVFGLKEFVILKYMSYYLKVGKISKVAASYVLLVLNRISCTGTKRAKKG
jgi:hypothetical protein